MSWLFSQALVAEYSAASSSAGAPSAPSSSTPTPRAYCSPDRMTDFSRLSRFGMTYAPLTDAHGAAVLTWYLAASPARTSVLLEQEKASKVSDPASGWKWPESSTKYDPATRSWRTRHYSLLGGLDEFSETWPKWGLMRDGECWELPTLAHRTSVTGFGLWPTPTVCGNYNRKGASANSGDGLATAVKMWPTPTRSDGCGGMGNSDRSGGLNLRTAIVMHATPTARDCKSGKFSPEAKAKRDEHSRGKCDYTNRLELTKGKVLACWRLSGVTLK